VEAQLITTDRREQTAGRLSIGGLSFVRTITAYEQGVKDGEAFCEGIWEPAAMFWPLLPRTFVKVCNTNVENTSTVEHPI
jgi:hypothetical protein